MRNARPTSMRWNKLWCAGALAKAMATSDMKTFMASQGAEIALLGPQEFGRYIEQEMVKWGKVARAAKLSAAIEDCVEGALV